VLAAGRVIEVGTYQRLLAGDGPFARMARQQGLTAAPREMIDPAFASTQVAV
jgi:hypothetical protein